ncbi:MAG TPA: branched-chain amino acid transaminase [Terracidiphilus sp.]|jgi:branched-chain amino acid aminotransferase|nr:branched-chain amino acid transaminase [Terracidiphilus sp.]
MQLEADQNLIVYFNGKYMRLGEAKVGILTHALHYGTGVFEGIRAHWNAAQQELFVLRPMEHYERWKRNCGILRIDVPLSPRQLTDVTLELMRRNRLETDVYVRPLAYKSAQRVGVMPDEQDAFAIVAMPFGEYLQAEKGLHAGVSSWRRVDDNAIPARAKICGAYVNSVLATDEARSNGFDEAILLNQDGHVAEGATCNLFMVRERKLITPPVYDNVLEGITRRTVMELARREMRLEVVERSIDRSELLVCDEVFFTGTAVGIAPIVRIEHRPVRDGAIGAVSRGMQQLYADAVRGRLREYMEWLTPVYQAQGQAEREIALAGSTV